MNKLEVEYIPVGEIIPYDKNPLKNDKAVDIVAKSITEFGFKNPIILDKNNVIICGHTRLKAAQKLGMIEVPVIWADDLTEEQVQAFRIMDNKSIEYADWDVDLLKEEFDKLKLSNYDLSLTGFNFGEIDNLDLVNGTNNEWVGMPDFEKKDDSLKIIIHFDNEKDREEFNKKYPFNYTTKQDNAWTMWWPYKEREDTSSLKYE